MELVWRKQSSWAFRSIDCELLSCWQFWFIKWIQHKHLLTENYAFSAETVFHFFTSRRHFLMLFSIPPRSFLNHSCTPRPPGLIINNLPPPKSFLFFNILFPLPQSAQSLILTYCPPFNYLFIYLFVFLSPNLLVPLSPTSVNLLFFASPHALYAGSSIFNFCLSKFFFLNVTSLFLQLFYPL